MVTTHEINRKIVKITISQDEVSADAREWSEANKHLSKKERRIKLHSARMQALAICFGSKGGYNESLCDNCALIDCIVNILR